MRALAKNLMAMTRAAAPSDGEDFGRLRVAISRALLHHFNAEDQAMGGAMWSKTGMPAQLLTDWDAKRQSFRQSYSQHLRDWALADALRDWSGYARAAGDCVKAAEALAMFEEAQIYPLIENRG